MIRFILRFLLSLFILLLSGYREGYAHDQKDTHYFSFENLKKQGCTNLGVLQQNKPNSFFKSFPSPHKNNFKIEVDEYEIEEDESFSSKKHFAVSGYFAGLFNAHLNGFLHCLKRLQFYKHFSYLSSDWSLYLIFCVFRI